MGRFLIIAEAFHAAAMSDFRTIRSKVILDIGRGTILKTPVDKGHARGGWQFTTDQPADNDVDRKADGAMTEMTGIAAGAGVEVPVFMSNLAPYIGKLEHGGYPKDPVGGKGKTSGGFSTQAPEGMLRTTIAEFDSIVKLATKGTKYGS